MFSSSACPRPTKSRFAYLSPWILPRLALRLTVLLAPLAYIAIAPPCAWAQSSMDQVKALLVRASRFVYVADAAPAAPGKRDWWAIIGNSRRRPSISAEGTVRIKPSGSMRKCWPRALKMCGWLSGNIARAPPYSMRGLCGTPAYRARTAQLNNASTFSIRRNIGGFGRPNSIRADIISLTIPSTAVNGGDISEPLHDLWLLCTAKDSWQKNRWKRPGVVLCVPLHELLPFSPFLLYCISSDCLLRRTRRNCICW